METIENGYLGFGIVKQERKGFNMDKNSPLFKDGLITEVRSTQRHIDFKFQCSSVDSGELSVSINTHSDGRIYLHFSNLGGKVIEANRECDNGMEIIVVERD